MIALSRHCLAATVSPVPPSICSGLFSSIDFGRAASLGRLSTSCRSLSRAVGNVVRGRPRQPTTSADVNTGV